MSITSATPDAIGINAAFDTERAVRESTNRAGDLPVEANHLTVRPRYAAGCRIRITHCALTRRAASGRDACIRRPAMPPIAQRHRGHGVHRRPRRSDAEIAHRMDERERAGLFDHALRQRGRCSRSRQNDGRGKKFGAGHCCSPLTGPSRIGAGLVMTRLAFDARYSRAGNRCGQCRFTFWRSAVGTGVFHRKRRRIRVDGDRPLRHHSGTRQIHPKE